jgi:hypothetical protein
MLDDLDKINALIQLLKLDKDTLEVLLAWVQTEPADLATALQAAGEETAPEDFGR